MQIKVIITDIIKFGWIMVKIWEIFRDNKSVRCSACSGHQQSRDEHSPETQQTLTYY